MLGFGVYFVLYVLRAMGAGDVKLMGADTPPELSVLIEAALHSGRRETLPVVDVLADLAPAARA